MRGHDISNKNGSLNVTFWYDTVIFAGSVLSAKNCFRDATLLMEVARLQLAIWYVFKIVRDSGDPDNHNK
jgi:hypothetical protein